MNWIHLRPSVNYHHPCTCTPAHMFNYSLLYPPVLPINIPHHLISFFCALSQLSLLLSIAHSQNYIITNNAVLHTWSEFCVLPATLCTAMPSDPLRRTVKGNMVDNATRRRRIIIIIDGNFGTLLTRPIIQCWWSINTRSNQHSITRNAHSSIRYVEGTGYRALRE